MKNQTIIVGSGIVGACMAIKIAQENHQVILIDAKLALNDTDWQNKLTRRDTRVFAVNKASINLLKSIGVWKYIKIQNRKVDYTQMHVWQTNGFSELNFAHNHNNSYVKDSAPYIQRIGSIIEPSVIEYALHQRLQDNDITKNIDMINGSKICSISQKLKDGQEEICVIELNDGRQFWGNLLIGADGRFSSVRSMSGINIDTLDYKQTAICCAIRTEKPHDFTARQAMLTTGTLALLPLADSESEHWQSVVWTLPTDKADTLLSLGDTYIADELAFASSYELGKVEVIESISSFPLVAQQATTYIQSNIALIGDAAHGIHPLAGQGLNLGLSDVASLFNNLQSDHKRMLALKLSANWGCWSTLQKYERERKIKNSQMMHGCSVLNWTFAGQFAQVPIFQHLRSEGMAMVNKQRWLIDWFNHQASGL